VELFIEHEADVALAATSTLSVATSPIHGLGVFTLVDLEPGDVVEVCPIVVCPSPDETHLEQTNLRGLYFHWDEDSVAVALGYGSLYNHAWQANARYEADGERAVIRFVAVRPIAAGDEVTVNYTGEPEGVGALWFEPE
jgi:SET domain-containing protein